MQNQIKLFYSKDFSDYEMLDTGVGEKLERFGPYTFVRPLEDAVWPKTLGDKEWAKADGKFFSSKGGGKGGLAKLKSSGSGWKMKNKIEEKWEMSYKGIKFLASPTPFRHLGFFPEQAAHWDFIQENLQKNSADGRFRPEGGVMSKNSFAGSPKFLNLFGYTGVASLFALRAGAEVTHLDASKQTLKWAKENQNLNPDLVRAPMRIIEDDVLKFLEREIKRGNKYDAVIMDPPKFGRGPKGETWKIEEMLPKLLDSVKKVLSDKPLFVILTSYAIDSSSLSLGHALSDAMADFGGQVESGELCIPEKSKNRLIPLANTAVWSRE